MDDMGQEPTGGPLARVVRFALLLLVVGGAASHAGLLPARRSEPPVTTAVDTAKPAAATTPSMDVGRAIDSAGLLSQWTLQKFERHLKSVDREVGVDIRLQLRREIPGGDLEAFALAQMRELGIGRDVDQRGLLFVYDLSHRRLRIEVGPGLEGDLPDGFVGYLMRDGASTFFAANNPDLALRTTLYIVNHRLREAALGDPVNRRALAFITDPARLAAGGGATAPAEPGELSASFFGRAATESERARFSPQQTPASAHALYQEWLRDGGNQIDVPLFAPGTEDALRAFPQTRAYQDFIFYGEYGHQYRMIVRDSLAMLVFTTTPFVSPHFFRRSAAGWQIDIGADIRNTREAVGGSHTWFMRDGGDDYSRTFSDLYVTMGRHQRIAGGDNRRLPIPKRAR